MGITTDGTHLWVVDNGSDKVFKYTVGGSLVGSWAIDSANGSPTGITINPSNVNHIWIVDNAADKVFQYNGGTTWTSGYRSASSTFELADGNGNPQGIADPEAVIGEAEATEVVAAAATTQRPSDGLGGGLWIPQPVFRPAVASRLTANVDEREQRVMALADLDSFGYAALSEDGLQDMSREPSSESSFERRTGSDDGIPVELLDEVFRDVSDALLEGVFA
jgi:hypothetical protein